MKVGLIISVYKNTKDLKVVLDSALKQSYKNFTTVISEDGHSDLIKNFVSSYSDLNLLHFYQEDNGWQKNKALNHTIKSTNFDYYIFIDGDCVMHPKFIENHVYFAEKKTILAGRRVKLGNKYSKQLRDGKAITKLTTNYRLKLLPMLLDGSSYFDEGIYVDNKNLQSTVEKFRKTRNIKGCNFSCYREALVAINGFDEDYILPAIGEDNDPSWRWRGLNYEIKSVRQFANQYHLNHKESWTNPIENLAMMEEKKTKQLFVCINGLQKLTK